MENRKKVQSMIGMAYKAGRVISGEDPVRFALKKNNIKLLIIAEDASENTKKRFINSAVYYHIPYFIYMTKEELSISLGQKIRSIAGITDEGFSDYLISLLNKY
ncbi:putative ribosomal protein YlxQ [bioreactor metagenome]|uniref:Putative ribosomal protein YlxQ n=1 Tax=bioreactor metagenome TaxID=1076179 RepID=A0A645DF67_9ZZZZ|nr:ribosomal L7Ae/L30e/S12e/Gadd45 family protein [Lutispora sp.]MEA4962719.1 ribosomal L7Ae/L30e/S12e/Gadd45 family protein [Lutispora sp.]